MTASKPRPKYDVWKDARPAKVCIGVSLITVETDSFIQDDRHVEVPVDDDIVYITVPREIVHLPCGGASYDIIADLLETQGYLRKHWRISHIWTCISPEEEPF